MPDNDATIQFLLRQSAKHEEAIGELSRLMTMQATRQADQYDKTQEQFRLTDQKIDKLGDRIERLVSAIGVLATRLPQQPA